MRKARYQKGSVKKQRGRWIGMWWQDKSRKSRVLGLVKDMTKSEARQKVDCIVTEVNAKQDANRTWLFGEFVRGTYLPFYARKWKASTKVTNDNRILVHLISEFDSDPMKAIQRDALQAVLDRKAAKGLSYSIVDHLRWDMKQVFDMAVAEGLVERNPALLLWTPRDAAKPVRRVMTIPEVKKCFDVLGHRERLIAKLAVIAGMRPGEIFALTWGRLNSTSAEIRQRVYRGIVDTPKTDQSVRKAALPAGLLREIELWREFAVSTADDAWVFPSENKTPLFKENCWRRHILPKLEKVGLAWVNFQVMRRTHATLMKGLGIDGKLVADQLGHGLDVSQNVYTQSPVEHRLPAVNELERSLQVM
jgi:integrase